MKVLENVRRMDRVKAKILMEQLYETQFGICDHTVQKPHRPFASIAFNPAYDSFAVSPLADLIFRYEDNAIYDVLRISFDVYISYPRHITTLLDHHSRIIRNKRDERLAGINKDLMGKGNTHRS